MATDALAIAAHASFKYRLELNGMPVAMVQKVSGGATSVGIVKHSGAGQNFDVKEPGKLEYAEITLECVVPVNGVGAVYFQNWIRKAQDPTTGNGQPRSTVVMDATLYDMSTDAQPIRTHSIRNAWCCECDDMERDSEAKDKATIDKIKIAYDWRDVA